MSSWLEVVLSVGAALIVVWIALVTVLYLAGRSEAKRISMRDALRLVPDVVRLLHRLARDPNLPRGVRIRLVLLLAYLAMPVDLVPDFIPVIGYADDVVIVALALRSVTRAAGADAIERHWPGTEEGLRSVRLLAGL